MKNHSRIPSQFGIGMKIVALCALIVGALPMLRDCAPIFAQGKPAAAPEIVTLTQDV